MESLKGGITEETKRFHPKTYFTAALQGKDLYLQSVCQPPNCLIISSDNRGGTAGGRTTVLRYFFLVLQSKASMHFSFFNVYLVSTS